MNARAPGHHEPELFAHTLLMPAVRRLHLAGLQSVYLWSGFSPSGASLRWGVAMGPQHRLQPDSPDDYVAYGVHNTLRRGLRLPLRAPLSDETVATRLLALAGDKATQQARAPDAEYAAWFAQVCSALLPDYAYYLLDDWNGPAPDALPVGATRTGLAPYAGPPLPWPPNMHWP